MTDLEKLVPYLLRSSGEVKVALESLEILPLNSAVDGERNPLVMCKARPQALKPAKPSQAEPPKAEPW